MVAVIALSGCGSIEYDDRAEVREVVPSGYYVAPAPAPAPGPYVMVLPPGPQAQPAPMPAARIQCAGTDHVRIVNQVIDGGNGPALFASGDCFMDIRESIVRGNPAVWATQGARVRLLESRIQGGIVAEPGTIVETPGSRLEDRFGRR